ncbi:Uncharacterized membrane protein YgdD, TMEM256/DUF423 family [Paramicrobacterium humi]|uniref:Uncharacterized membrane protein YgdD, TMEM256/DUF423 family n=1 Tax=Paramicrobacterium humi TaxID=640635 RepID=A0A1H4JF14_9MICO|nr:hypothetical protein [Microbacterium humi]SEB44929.1 Uncharacterized membrane protein YgdD, TMEM256/DUF423 family [Microbacterium humi]
MSSVTTARVERVAGWRVVCDRILQWVALLGLVLALLQVAFAALGFWGAEEKPGDQAWGMAAFEPHAIDGQVLYIVAAVMFILGLLSRANWKVWVIPLVLFILLYFVQGLLVGLGFGISRWFGFLHAVDGVLIIAGFAWVFFDRLRHPLRGE